MDLDRDFIGYGAHPPHARWPGNARIAINFVMNYEEGSEPSIGDGEAATETWFTESHGLNSGVRGRDLAAEGLFEYGSRVGFWRLMRLFRERGLPLTVYGCALALERNPQAAEAIRHSGFDVCSHGWRWIKHYDLSEEEEREHIRRVIESLERTTGERPYGWYCRYSPSVNTRRLLVEEGGFLYDSDYYGDELPFWKVVQGQPHLVIPYSLTTNDGQFAGSVGTANQWFEFMRDSFDMLYSEGATQPKMMSVGLHMRLIGHPARAAGLQRFLDHVMKHEDVWVTRRIDIANHWIKEHPFVR
ncbi:MULTISPECIES: polysaccharide deacetylase family protein [unclassified Caballeronia]|uniref:polysaccharide deacetylase family protein n=1 Tax=unclassified Caballeronia TaxID=2646786 RepID=UPI002855476F|nr:MULTISPECIES: polysaccharide deacetylase family protein [unclassified Caballeronia]MDR5774219.1 polysaccharide deacetylase family protein [Caballeronia sp. LZ002]MDR5849654.1 polysaccharide deacetylase family protein [Caballeronia sp. LZ003]